MAKKSSPAKPAGPIAPLARWSSISCRTVHIGVASVFFGGSVLHVPTALLIPWLHLAIATGAGLVLLELLHDRRWPHRGKGLLALFHAGLAAVAHLAPAATVPVLWGTLVIGCIGSHMQRRYRHWSFLDGWEQPEPRR